MHPVARVFQILFLLGGLGMFVYALAEAPGNSHTGLLDFRYECTTVNTGTAERPQPEETCEDQGATFTQHGTDEVLVDALAGLGLMIGAAAVSVGGARRSSGTSTPPVPVAQPYGGPGPFPPAPGHSPAQAR